MLRTMRAGAARKRLLAWSSKRAADAVVFETQARTRTRMCACMAASPPCLPGAQCVPYTSTPPCMHACMCAGPSGAEREFDDDEDSAKGMARLFVEVGEAYLSLIITASQEVRVRRVERLRRVCL